MNFAKFLRAYIFFTEQLWTIASVYFHFRISKILFNTEIFSGASIVFCLFQCLVQYFVSFSLASSFSFILKQQSRKKGNNSNNIFGNKKTCCFHSYTSTHTHQNNMRLDEANSNVFKIPVKSSTVPWLIWTLQKFNPHKTKNRHPPLFI